MSESGFTSLDLMAIDTADLTFSSPSKRAALRKREESRIEGPVIKTRIAKDIDLTSTSNITQPKKTWWHMGTEQKAHKEPINFQWAIKPKKAQGGLDFGLKLSGSTMPFSGRKRVFI